MSSSSVTSSDKIKTSGKNILIGCTGSVATIKIPILVRKLTQSGNFNIKVVATEHSKHFFRTEEIPEAEVLTDKDEWNAWKNRGDPVVHIELCKWADLFLIAPLDANTLGKLAGGLCDNLLTCVARAWNLEKPVFFCPAMNTKMYEHPITSTQISTLVHWGYTEIPVTSKVLVCGDKGLGAMAEVDTIVETKFFSLLKKVLPFPVFEEVGSGEGRKVGTLVPIDICNSFKLEANVKAKFPVLQLKWRPFLYDKVPKALFQKGKPTRN